MRPAPSSALRHPLNFGLGTDARVRVLRVLLHTSEPMTRAGLAVATRLTKPATAAVVAGLEVLGLVRPVGIGARQGWVCREEHALIAPLRSLFDAETSRFERLIAELRSAVSALEPAMLGAWLEGDVATEADRPGEPVTVVVMVDDTPLSELRPALRGRLDRVEARFDLTIESTIVRRGELPPPRGPEKDTLHLYGLDRAALSRPVRTAVRKAGHQDRDAELLARGAQIAEAIARNPDLVKRAHRRLEQRLKEASPRARPALEEWKTILATMSTARLRRFLVDRGERATRLRQSMPFAGLLSESCRRTAG